MRKTKKSSNNNSSTSDSECCQHGDADASSPKQLDDGFFEIETIRRKRLRKGEVQYLIKWRGWPETANTWEPLHNLQSVPDLIHAFEESLKSAATSAAGGAKPLRKRTRRTTTTHLPPQTTNAHPTPLPNSQQHIPHQNQPTSNLPQQTPIHAQSNGNSLHRRGTNRRKSASVKRFKKDESSPTNNALGSTAPYVGNNINTHQIITGAKTASNIVKIIKAIGYSTSLSCYKQDILVTFMAMRSDGTEVMVDNKYLKANNPQLLINFYEQHLRYNPT
ncbi:putative chromatin remodeling & transcriptional activation CHROMO-DOMAIN family [Medicago truncatula]|uniref:Putative chromatin remodeling & transcriptional activation CHROMO-DOMAIN family n=1 Tax=Medicago truncatula TaxID=3880 RepID=A0A396J8D1_MEDTR|nr:chromo domain-containing protein LHP1-like [Medicago truncatula]XP_024635769.1 chromo domain-containing protein LHP1-like [Medicago truncatula]RHN71407.1 putative chromatin remodeling & transcriptional activation CHROMO-DOMAIN family [Medicago truncatula]